jgi:uncharacterized membrane protein YdbT with pleckstrin-like domain
VRLSERLRRRIRPPGYRPAVAAAVEEEHELWSGRPSWRGRMAILVPGVLLTLLVLGVCIWAGASATLTLVVVVVVALVTVVWAFIETLRWKYTITNRRVFVRHGLISINEQTARLERVQDITLHQTLFDRMFGVGRLLIDTAGSSGGALEFKALLEPTHVREVLETAVRAERHELDRDV